MQEKFKLMFNRELEETTIKELIKILNGFGKIVLLKWKQIDILDKQKQVSTTTTTSDSTSSSIVSSRKVKEEEKSLVILVPQWCL